MALSGWLGLEEINYNQSGWHSIFNACMQKLNNWSKKRTATAINYTATSQDWLIGVTDTSASRTITLPPASGLAGKQLVIKDESGAAGTNNITVDGNASETIDGTLTAVISTNYGALRLYCDGSNWFTW